MTFISKTAGHFNWHGRYVLRTTAGLCICLWGSVVLGAVADEHGLHLHEPVQVSATLRWPELIEETLINYPRFAELSARDAEARVLAERGGKWFSGAPAFYFGYLSDSAFTGTDMEEYAFGLQMSLWRPGQRSAAQLLGSTASTESAAASAALRHQVIGLLRTALWDIERAVIAVELAEDGVAVARELLRVVERRHTAGDLPLGDTLLARSSMLERESTLIESNATLLDAERAYRSLTGLDSRPAYFEETPNLREQLDDSHPWLLMAEAAVERAGAELDLASTQAKNSPTLTIGTRRERGPFSDLYVDSLGMAMTVPFGGRAHKDAAVSDSFRQIAAAKAERAQLVRELQLDLHEAHHNLVVIDASLELATERSELAERRLQMSEQAFAQGEMTLFELLLQQELARNTQREAAGLEVERQRAIAEINQALGEWP